MIDLPLVSLDLELLDGDNGAEIIEVGAVKFRGDATLGTFGALVKPSGQLSHRILSEHCQPLHVSTVVRAPITVPTGDRACRSAAPGWPTPSQ